VNERDADDRQEARIWVLTFLSSRTAQLLTVVQVSLLNQLLVFG
jgi:hypothetical protein